MVTEVHDVNEGGFNLRLEARLKNAALMNAREQLGLTAKAAAELIGVSYQQYVQFETMNRYPGAKNRARICEFYGLVEEEVFPEELRGTKSGKLIVEKEIPRSQLIALTEASHQHLLPPVQMGAELEREEMREEIGKVLDKLTPNEARILRAYYGINGEESLTFAQIGDSLGISGGRVQQIHARAIQKIRSGRMAYGHRVSPPLGRHLEDYWASIQ